MNLPAYFSFVISKGILPDSLSPHLILTLFLSLSAGLLSYKARFLTLSGTLTASIMAMFLFGLGGFQWLFPVIVFFILSSLLSKLRKFKNPGVEKYFEKTGVRDYKQVIANGGFGVVLILLDQFIKSGLIYLCFIGLLSVVCADTWSTETGTMFRVKTYNILNLKKTEQGISGGVSITGFAGSILGSAAIALSSFIWIKSGLIQFFMIVIFVGLIGNIIDSIIGASLQAQYICKECNLITEKNFHCNSGTVLIRGKKWIDNDFVNLISGVSGCILILLFQQLF